MGAANFVVPMVAESCRSGTQAAPSAVAAGFFALLSPLFVLPCEKGVNRSLVSVFRLLEDPNAIISKRR